MTKRTMVIIAVVLYLLFRVFILEPNALEVRDYWIEDSRLSGIKIAFLSDFNTKKSGVKRLQQIVDKTRAQNPDLLLLGGDFVYNQNLSQTLSMNSIAYAIGNIQVPTYAVLGDDDWKTDKSKTIADALRSNKIYVLDDSAVRISLKGKTIDIAGVRDKSQKQPNITKALRRTRKPRILLSHNPDIYYDVMEDVTLILAGHTHGGQVIFPYAPALFVPSQFGSKFAGGLIKETNNTMIISRGLGTNKFPGRLNCKPEIVMIHFCTKGRCKANPK